MFIRDTFDLADSIGIDDDLTADIDADQLTVIDNGDFDDWLQCFNE
jgi:hypothetical protein